MSAQPYAQLAGRDEAQLAKSARNAQHYGSLARAVCRAHEHGYRRAVRAYRWIAGYALGIGFAAGVLAAPMIWRLA